MRNVQSFISTVDNSKVFDFSAGDNSAASKFSVDPVSGWVTTLAPLDYEEVSTYRLYVTVKDGGVPPRQDNTVIDITVEDIVFETPTAAEANR